MHTHTTTATTTHLSLTFTECLEVSEFGDQLLDALLQVWAFRVCGGRRRLQGEILLDCVCNGAPVIEADVDAHQELQGHIFVGAGHVE
jgi:hypothetical protein